MNTVTLSGRTVDHTSWHTISVRTFFEQMPWTGVPVQAPTRASGAATSAPIDTHGLSLHQTVSEYFQRFPWDGQPHIAAPIAPIEIQPNLPVEDSMTLDGFADLF